MKCSQSFVSRGIALAVLSVVLGGSRIVWSQTEHPPSPPPSLDPMKTFYLKNPTQQNEGNEIVNGLRVMLDPRTKLYLVSSQNAIVMRGTPDQFVLAQQFLDEIDRPKRTYRLVYSINESDGGKRVGSQHFAMVLVSGQRMTLKQGSKVPIVTGAYSPGSSTQNEQVTYLDVGMNFDATISESGQEITLRSKVERSAVAEEKSGIGAQDPVVRQSVLEGLSMLTPGRTLVLGSLDTPGSTRHLDVEVVLELVK